MFRYPWLAASLALVVFTFSIEVAATKPEPPDPYGPILRDCSLSTMALVNDKGYSGCNLLSIKPEIMNSCLCGPKRRWTREVMKNCVQQALKSGRYHSENPDLWPDFMCSTCRTTKINGRQVFVPPECPKSKNYVTRPQEI